MTLPYPRKVGPGGIHWPILVNWLKYAYMYKNISPVKYNEYMYQSTPMSDTSIE